MRSAIISAVLLGSLNVAIADPATDAFPTRRGPNSCGTPNIGEPVALPEGATAAPGAQRVIWVNRFGGAYTFADSGGGNSATNIASAIVYANPGGHPASVQIPPMTSGFDWPTILACVKTHYQPFNVRIVESRPRTGMYEQAAVGGNGSEMGFPPSAGILGIAGSRNLCAVNETGIAFCFSEPHKSIPQADAELCATIAHELGHLLALEHEIKDTDLMSYVPVADSHTKAFQDFDSQCGTDSSNIMQCTCSQGTTNSAQRLDTFVGPRQMESVKPTLTINSPSNGDTVAPSFTLTATASDDKAMADVRVLGTTALGNNIELGNAEQQDGGKWKVEVDGLLIGQQPITVIARDEAGNETSSQLTVTVKKAALGEDCASNASCDSNLCGQLDDDKFCTQTCSSSQACPSGFSCSDPSSGVCTPDGGGGCCQAAGPNDAITGLFVLGLGAIVVRRRKRR
ncbi:MAG TPA: Ig-like domain-containing protein [Kofleriaceae bacterium]|jgi:hypothetical protein